MALALSTYPRYRWAVLAAVASGQIAASAFYLCWPALTTFLRDDFGLNHEQVGLVLGAVGAGSAIGSVPLGGLSDRVGAHRMLAGGLLAMALTAVVATFSPTFATLFVGVAAAGLAYGALNPAGVKVLVGWFPSRELGTAIGFKQLGYPVGGALAAATLPALTLAFGSWRPSIVLVGAFIALVGLVTLGVVRGMPRNRPPAVMAAGRWWTPLLRRNVLLLGPAGFLYGGLLGAWLGYLVLYAEEGLGLPITAGAGLLALTQLAAAPGRVVIGMMSDRLFGGRRRELLVYCGLGGGLAAGVLPLLVSPSPLLLGLLVVVFGLSTGCFTTPQFAALANEGGERSGGMTVGLGMSLNSAGNLVFPPIFGRIVDTTGSYTPAWTLVALAGLLGAALTLAVRERVGGAQ